MKRQEGLRAGSAYGTDAGRRLAIVNVTTDCAYKLLTWTRHNHILHELALFYNSFKFNNRSRQAPSMASETI